MKTRIAQIFALATMLLLFTACQKDSLVDDISPDYTIDDSIETRSSGAVEFELWQYVEVIQHDCSDAPEMVKYREEDATQILKTSGCDGTYGLTASARIYRSDNSDGTASTEVIKQNIGCNITLDTPFTVSLQGVGNDITFTCEDSSYTYTVPNMYNHFWPFSRIRNAVFSAGSEQGYLKFYVDNVKNSTGDFPWTMFLPAIITNSK